MKRYTDQHQAYMLLADRDMHTTLIWLVVILNFKMSAFTKLANSTNNALNGFPEPGDIGQYTKIKSIRVCASHTDIWAKHYLIAGYIEIQDGRLHQVNQYYK
jgi:hypothetical protein